MKINSRCRPSVIGLMLAALVGVLDPPVQGGDCVGPFAGWADVKRDFHATGDGKSDDTVALQKALDALRDEKGQTRAVYLPAGTYRITRTLTLPRKPGAKPSG